MCLSETIAHVLSAETRSKVSVFSYPNHYLQGIYEDKYSLKGQEYSNKQPLLLAIFSRNRRPISIAQNCGVDVKRICKLLQIRVTSATSHAATFRKIISHDQNVTIARKYALFYSFEAKKYENLCKIKIFSQFHYFSFMN